jgi:hypothetical protein
MKKTFSILMICLIALGNLSCSNEESIDETHYSEISVDEFKKILIQDGVKNIDSFRLDEIISIREISVESFDFLAKGTRVLCSGGSWTLSINTENGDVYYRGRYGGGRRFSFTYAYDDFGDQGIEDTIERICDGYW